MKLLIVGLGAIGQRHIRNLRALLGDSIELLAARSRGLSHVLSDAMTVEAREGLCEKYGIRAFATLDDALAHKPDVAFVCNPTSLHIGTALALARAGCHLFIEKPLAHEYLRSGGTPRRRRAPRPGGDGWLPISLSSMSHDDVRIVAVRGGRQCARGSHRGW